MTRGMARDMTRGDVFYVSVPHQTGSEIAKSRPAVIVSSDDVIRTQQVINVVYLSEGAVKRAYRPGVVPVHVRGVPSAAVCEQITSVDRSRIESYVGHLTPDEMRRIEIGIVKTLSLPEIDRETLYSIPLLHTYKHLYQDLLDRVTGLAQLKTNHTNNN